MEDAKRRAAEAKGRVQRVEQSVESLASQAKKLESVLKENMANAAELNAREAAAKFQDAMTPSVTELELDDPLERKFPGAGGPMTSRYVLYSLRTTNIECNHID